MKNPNEIEFCNLPEQTEDNYWGALATDLMKEKMNAAHEYAKMWYEDDKERARQCAVDFEIGATWGINTTKAMTVHWLKENFPKDEGEFKDFLIHFDEFIDQYLYDLQ